MKKIAFGVKIAALAVSAMSLSVGTAKAGVIVGAVNATVNVGGSYSTTPIADSYNQNGLSTKYVSGVTDFDTYLAAGPTHTAIYQNYEWFSNFAARSVVTYDLGAIKTIGSVALWNEESNGINSLDLFSSSDNVSFTKIGTYQLPRGGGGDYAATRIDFQSTAGQYLRLDATSCGGNFCSIGEVAFNATSAVPEPATWAMMLVGFGAVGASMRRRKQTLRVRFA